VKKFRTAEEVAKDKDRLEVIRERFQLPIVEEVKVAYGTGPNWNISPKHKAIRDAKTGKLLGLHSPNYRTVKHEEGIVLLEDAIVTNPEFGEAEWAVEQYDDGRRARVVARFHEVEYPITNGDVVNPRMEYYNSYDGGWAEKFIFGAFRLVCANGLIVGERFLFEKVIHWGEERPVDIQMLLRESMHRFSTQVDLWKQWADRKLDFSIDQYEQAVAPFGIKQRKEIAEEVDKENSKNALSLWVFYNILTWYITHKIQSLQRKVSLENHLRGVTAGW
jgi:hypothetical protein